jgi:predicted alpha/beta-fold hydrolase
MPLQAGKPFQPHPLLKNAHAMTIAAAFWHRRFCLPQPESRYFRVDADSQLLAHCHWQPGNQKSTPVLVLVHGLEGSSDSSYMLGMGEHGWQRGFHVVRLNQRNCGGTESLTPTLYNSGMSGDYRAVLDELSQRDGYSQIFFAGYSMGGNLVSKMAGEIGEDIPTALKGVAAVCPALDLAACANALEQRDNYFYQRRFVAGLLERYARKALLFPERYLRNGLGSIRTVRQFDDVITAPQFGFRDAQEYYESAGAKQVIPSVRVPLLVIASKDDPFVPFEATRASGVEQNPAVIFEAPQYGGHCGFVSNERGTGRFWAEQSVVEFCAGLVRGAASV